MPARISRRSNAHTTPSVSATRFRSMHTLRCIAILVTALASSCGAPSAQPGIPTSANPRLREATLTIGSVSLVAEIAATEDQRTRGLMYRQKLADGHGMLFVFDRDERPAFWMKNTSLPLSIAYITANGTITQILDLVPYSEEPRPSLRYVRYALEVPQGWFSRVGIREGDRVTIPSLR